MIKKPTKPKKLLIARLGAGSITVALCAALPGCNLAIHPSGCTGDPSSRGMSTSVCPDGQVVDTGAASDGPRDATADGARDTASGPGADATNDRGSGDLL